MFKVVSLGAHHDRAGFDCGVEPLNRYLQQIAWQHESKGVSRTYVLVEEGAEKSIVGYFTLTFCQVDSGILSAAWAKKLPRQVPAMRLGRLAVSRAMQKQGVGQLLVAAACRLVEQAEKIAGGIGLFVDAKDERAAAYYARFGFVPLQDNPLTLFLPQQTVRQHNAATR